VLILFFQIFKTSFNFPTTLTLIVENHLIEFRVKSGIILPFLLLNEKERISKNDTKKEKKDS